MVLSSFRAYQREEMDVVAQRNLARARRRIRSLRPRASTQQPMNNVHSNHSKKKHFAHSSSGRNSSSSSSEAEEVDPGEQRGSGQKRVRFQRNCVDIREFAASRPPAYRLDLGYIADPQVLVDPDAMSVKHLREDIVLLERQLALAPGDTARDDGSHIDWKRMDSGRRSTTGAVSLNQHENSSADGDTADLAFDSRQTQQRQQRQQVGRQEQEQQRRTLVEFANDTVSLQQRSINDGAVATLRKDELVQRWLLARDAVRLAAQLHFGRDALTPAIPSLGDSNTVCSGNASPVGDVAPPQVLGRVPSSACEPCRTQDDIPALRRSPRRRASVEALVASPAKRLRINHSAENAKRAEAVVTPNRLSNEAGIDALRVNVDADVVLRHDSGSSRCKQSNRSRDFSRRKPCVFAHEGLSLTARRALEVAEAAASVVAVQASQTRELQHSPRRSPRGPSSQ